MDRAEAAVAMDALRVLVAQECPVRSMQCVNVRMELLETDSKNVKVCMCT